jgi:hypothetical protein
MFLEMQHKINERQESKKRNNIKNYDRISFYQFAIVPSEFHSKAVSASPMLSGE